MEKLISKGAKVYQINNKASYFLLYNVKYMFNFVEINC